MSRPIDELILGLTLLRQYNPRIGMHETDDAPLLYVSPDPALEVSRAVWVVLHTAGWMESADALLGPTAWVYGREGS